MVAGQSRGANVAAVTPRCVVLVSADVATRHRLSESLQGMRWTVREAGGGAEAMGLTDQAQPEALVIDSWLPDLEAEEFAGQMGLMYPGIDVLRMDGVPARGVASGVRSPRRHELLHAIREAAESSSPLEAEPAVAEKDAEAFRPAAQTAAPACTTPVVAIPEMVGESAGMAELARLIRLVAPRSATVLIEGETGSGKEVVAKAIHRMSARAGKPFAVLNCAAIPESLLEAELFGHTRGAFTGAVQSRTGRIEAANGGTLFLDEIGEMPLALQAKMLRFLEYGELQRVGENDTVRVDVRVIAATHQPLETRSAEGLFRLDLYHRLAVFPVEVPALRTRLEDLPLLVEFFLERMGQEHPRKTISRAAMDRLRAYSWPGNVRELMHVLERASILAGDSPEITPEAIRLRSRG